jgi:hypothetical protein
MFKHIPTYSVFQGLKISANSNDTQYSVGVDGNIINGVPDIKWQSIAFIKDVQKIWTHGQLYDCSGGSSNIYVKEVESLLSFPQIDFQDYIIISETEWLKIANNNIFIIYDSHRTIVFNKAYIGASYAVFYGYFQLTNDVDSIIAKATITNNENGEYRLSLSEIPSVTESTVSNWGFTKNTGTITGVSANGTSVATSGVANIPAASTSKYGVTKLSSSTSSTSTSLAATASAVKSAYDLANGRQVKLVSGTNIKTINGESILGAGDITIESGGDSIPIIELPTGLSGTLDESQLTVLNNEPNMFIALLRVSHNALDYVLFTRRIIVGSGVFYYSAINGRYTYTFEKNGETYSVTQTDLALKSDIPNTDDFLQYDNQQAITVQGINNGNGATYAIPGSDIADGGEYVDTFALKSEIPDITGLATQANLTSAVTQLTTNIAKKQDKLVSGTNIATINNNSILGSGNFDLATSAQLRDYQPKLVSGTSIKTINGESILGSGNIEISGGGSSDANVQAVDTGDVLDDVNVEYVTKTYVDGLVGDINSVLESIINGGVANVIMKIINGVSAIDIANTLINTYGAIGSLDNPNPINENIIFSGFTNGVTENQKCEYIYINSGLNTIYLYGADYSSTLYCVRISLVDDDPLYGLPQIYMYD